MLGFDGISSFAVSAVKETGCIGLYGVGYRFFFFLIVLGGWGNVVAWSFYMLMTPLFSQPHISIDVSSWWLNHPSEKYARQIGSFPQIGLKIKNY